MLQNNVNDKIDILGLNMEKMKEVFSIVGLKKFNASQVFDWLHNKLIFDFDKFTNISKNDRETLKKNSIFPYWSIEPIKFLKTEILKNFSLN